LVGRDQFLPDRRELRQGRVVDPDFPKASGQVLQVFRHFKRLSAVGANHFAHPVREEEPAVIGGDPDFFLGEKLSVKISNHPDSLS
jgi:hypothetical protein